MAEYIEREKFCKSIMRNCRNFEDMKDVEYAGLLTLLEPAADVVEVVHGKWKFNRDGSGTCNQCHTTQKNVWDYDSWQNYCGHCGAKMDGERWLDDESA